MLQGEEVWNPKIINIKQYLNTNIFSVNNRHFFIDTDVSKTDETLHDECIFKSRK
jgi:hypothetical protein